MNCTAVTISSFRKLIWLMYLKDLEDFCTRLEELSENLSSIDLI